MLTTPRFNHVLSARSMTPPPPAPPLPPLPPSLRASAAVGREIFINGTGRPHHNHKHDDVVLPHRGGSRGAAPPAESPSPATGSSPSADEDAPCELGRTAVISLHAPPSITTTKVQLPNSQSPHSHWSNGTFSTASTFLVAHSLSPPLFAVLPDRPQLPECRLRLCHHDHRRGRRGRQPAG